MHGYVHIYYGYALLMLSYRYRINAINAVANSLKSCQVHSRVEGEESLHLHPAACASEDPRPCLSLWVRQPCLRPITMERIWRADSTFAELREGSMGSCIPPRAGAGHNLATLCDAKFITDTQTVF